MNQPPMNCDLFRRSLRAYLRGDIPEPAFGVMVEHEAECDECRRVVTEMTAEVDHVGELSFAAVAAAETSESDLRGTDSRASDPQRLDLGSLLGLTTGADCAYVEQRLGEAPEEPLTKDLLRLVDTHLEACPSCRQLRDVLEDLPRWYATLPVLRADRAFKAEVLRRTLGPEPGFWDVLRALWRRPEAVWEAAVACALVTFILFGSAVGRRAAESELPNRASLQGVGSAVGSAVVRGIDDGASRAGRVARAPYTLVRDGFDGLHGFSSHASSWMERVVTNFRTGDYEELLNDLRVVLEPIGLYPDPAVRTADPATETAVDPAPSDAKTETPREDGTQ